MAEVTAAAKRPRLLAWRLDRLHLPSPNEIGTMCGLCRGPARRLGLGAILALARRQANRDCVFAHQLDQS
jgi:hypothetical protein